MTRARYHELDLHRQAHDTRGVTFNALPFASAPVRPRVISQPARRELKRTSDAGFFVLLALLIVVSVACGGTLGVLLASA